MKQNWYEQTIEQVYATLQTTGEGLSDEVVRSRVTQYGTNTLPQKPPDGMLILFLRQFKSPLIYILLAVGVIELVLGAFTDAIVIGIVLMFNAVAGTVQEGRAQNTLAALRNFVQTQTLVRRNGIEELIADTELVPGDIVILHEGDKIPADARLSKPAGITIDESSLTGESEPVLKDSAPLHIMPPATRLYPHEKHNMVFKGTHVVAGQGECIVVATGLSTEIGKLSQTLTQDEKEIPLQANIRRLSQIIMYAVAIISGALLVIGVLGGTDFFEMLKTVVSLAVSIIPEGLPVVLTLVLANGVWRMGQRKALVKKLAAVEALGQATIIAVDKTGTITKNELLLQKVVVKGKTFDILGSGYNPSGDILFNKQVVSPLDVPELILAGKIAAFSSAELLFVPQTKTWTVVGEPTEAAMLVFSHKVGFKSEDIAVRHPVLQEIPFDYQTKFRAVVFKDAGAYMLAVVGAPEVIARLSNVSDVEVHHLMAPLSHEALRVVAFAFATVPGQVDPGHLPSLTFGGLFGMRDALHDEVPAAVADVQSAGIRTVMITGDHTQTAQAIAQLAGIYRAGDSIMAGAELETLTPAELETKLNTVSVFARVTPEHKLRIVQELQKRGNTVAMTGDGVNDVPSLVAADLGIAMGVTGTEVTKEAADIVLMDDNFATIAAAVEEGRNIYKTIQRALLYLFSTSFGELFVIAGGLILGLPLPVIAVQILWLNFVTDGFLTVAFAMEPKEGNLLRTAFEKPNRYLVNTLMVKRMLPMGLIMMVGTLVLFDVYQGHGYVKATTMAATVLAVFQWFNAWNCRSEERSIFHSIFSNPYLIIATLVVVILQLLAVYLPVFQKLLHTTALSWREWVIIIVVASTVLMYEEGRKFLSRHHFI